MPPENPAPALPPIETAPILLPMASQSATDQQLLEAAQAGDQRAIEALLLKHQDRIYRFGMRFCGDASDAEDVTQETLLAMAKALPRFEGRASLSTWLYSVARSFCIKKRRKSKFAPNELQPLDEAAERSREPTKSAAGEPEAALEAKQLEHELERAIRGLDPEQREVLILRDIEGLSAAEVAQVLDLSVSAVKSRLHRARLKVREHMAPFLRSDPLPQAAGSQCPDVLSLYSRHLEGEIEASVCQAMQAHVEACPRCSAVCDSLKQTLALCGAASTAQVPPEVQQAVRRALREFLADPGSPTA